MITIGFHGMARPLYGLRSSRSLLSGRAARARSRCRASPMVGGGNWSEEKDHGTRPCRPAPRRASNATQPMPRSSTSTSRASASSAACRRARSGAAGTPDPLVARQCTVWTPGGVAGAVAVGSRGGAEWNGLGWALGLDKRGSGRMWRARADVDPSWTDALAST
ncbi:hypothetical protein PVAP13_8KG004621 [Panicum virgatum]|uniref:Uncharacterized protein n=1 Tax=Panicum virgatum TaxID=38727 RepID=A0A8T0PHT3_PANVG|nr:hypothetical protein PVAP13_8KG004621 [Panicum virgatum]